MPEPDFSFRLRFHLPRNGSLGIKDPIIKFVDPESAHPVRLLSCTRDEPIADAKRLQMIGSGWESEEAAQAAGEVYTDILSRTLAHLRIGADVGLRAPVSRFTPAGLEMMENAASIATETDQERVRVLNDVHGLMV